MTTYNKGDRYTLDVTIDHTMRPNANGEVPISLPRGRWVFVPASALRPWTPPAAPEEPTELGTIVLVGKATFVLTDHGEESFRRAGVSGWYSWQGILNIAAATGEEVKVVTPEQVRSL